MAAMLPLLIALAVQTSPAALPPADQGEESMNPTLPRILSLRERAAVQDAWLKERLDTLAPALMREHGIDMWVLVAREYLEDPVMSTMLNATNLRARRRTVLILWDPGDGRPVERLVVNKHGMGEMFAPAWDMAKEPDQWRRIGALIAERKPKRIAVNVSAESAFADGLTKSQHDGLMAALTPELRSRVVPGYPLAIGWLETRTPAEMARYGEIVRAAHAIIGEGFSARVVKPGVTTNHDLVWWYRQRVSELGLASWFHPSVEISRRGVNGVLREEPAAIERGDMLRVDFGITYLGLNTDTQHVAYVLRPGESDAPAGLKAGLRASNAVQDAVTSEMRAGDTGNAVLGRARAKALAQGLNPTIYSHPIGTHGHGAGSAIRQSEEQRFVAHGEHRLRPNTAWSIELKATQPVPEWDGQMVDFKTEEDAFFADGRVTYIDGRQTRFHLIDAR
jgi:hypothetical protein